MNESYYTSSNLFSQLKRHLMVKKVTLITLDLYYKYEYHTFLSISVNIASLYCNLFSNCSVFKSLGISRSSAYYYGNEQNIRFKNFSENWNTNSETRDNSPEFECIQCESEKLFTNLQMMEDTKRIFLWGWERVVIYLCSHKKGCPLQYECAFLFITLTIIKIF